MHEIRRQLDQQRRDAVGAVGAARSRRDQRGVDHFSGRAVAYQSIIETIELSLHEDDDPGRRH